MNKKISWTWLIGVFLLGGIIGFMIGEDYERKRIIQMEVDYSKKEMQEALEKSNRFLDSLKIEHPELFKK
ncbi:hypothetical protein [Spirosoma litoris]